MYEFESSKEVREIKEICLRLLTRREHSQKELRDKLVQKGFDPSQVHTVINGLAQQNWQSDQRFAESYVRHRIKKGFGPNKINYEIQQRGVHGVDLDDILLDLADNWLELLKQVYRKKYTENKPLTHTERFKRSRFLLQRGFSSEMINQFFQQIRK